MAFHRDLTDTIIELELIVSNFQKYGDPKAGLKLTAVPKTFNTSRAAESTQELAYLPPRIVRVHGDVDIEAIMEKARIKALEIPERITWPWVRDNMTPNGWKMVLGALGIVVTGAFGLGLLFGATPITQKLLARWFGV